MIINEDVLNHVQHLFENVFHRPLTDVNRRQAEVPANCTVLHNSRGTAPGMMFEKDAVVYIAMPGVPHEMKGIMTDKVIPLFKQRFESGIIIHHTLLTFGIGESFLAEHINEWEQALPEHLKLAYLPGYGMVRLRITGSGSNRESLESEMNSRFASLKERVKQWLVTDEDISFTQAISKLLKERGKTICTAESCTGGYISHLITSEAGSSSIFKGTVVCYANEVKKDVLHVKDETLRNFGAVSEQTVKEMLIGAVDLMKTDYGIATSGIMGPDGGTDEKPVGTVWIAAGNRDNMMAQKFNFRFDRARNIELTAIQALNLLRRVVLEIER